MNKINAAEYVGRGFPPEEGKKLADALLKKRDLVWDGLAIDVSTLSPAMLISAFFNGFLQEVFEKNRALLDKAQRVKWMLHYAFQEANVATWMKNFKPYTGPTV